jgi:hypothetical protein
MEIQQDFQVEPEAGSYLAVDDELRQQAAQNLTQVAMANPDIVDRRKVIRFQMSTIRGIGNPDDYFLPEQPQSPPPPKVNVNLQVPMDKMPGDVVNQLLPMIGLQPSQMLDHQDQMNAVQKTAESAQSAGEAADSLLSPGEADQDQQQQAHEAAQQASDQAHEAAQQDDQHLTDATMQVHQQMHDLRSQALDHQNTMTQNAQEHGHTMQQAEQANRHALTQGAQQQQSQVLQKGAQIASQERQHGAGLQSQERIAKSKANGKPKGGKPNGSSAARSESQSQGTAAPTAVLHLKIEHGPSARKRTVKLIKGADGMTTGAEINEE